MYTFLQAAGKMGYWQHVKDNRGHVLDPAERIEHL
jgi:hypothetical protein